MSLRNVLFGATLCIAATAVDACSHDSQSPTPNDTSVSVSVLGTPTFTVGQTTDGFPVANCTISLMAQLTNGKLVTWSDATFYWYSGLDRSKASDSAVATAADVESSWDTASIDSVGVGKGGWYVSYALPFDLDIVFHYTTASSTDLHTVRTSRMTCGPAAPQGSVAPPSISQLSFVQPRAQWQPSDTMWVQFQAASTSNLWLTYADFSGAFTADSVYNDALQPSAQHVVHTRIPASATLGAGAVTTVYAVDPFGQEVKQSIQTSPLVDITPPTLQLYDYPPPDFGMTATLGGTYFAGDSIYFIPSLSDNGAVQAFVWHASPGAYTDSLPPSAVGGPFLKIPVHPEWGDSVQFRFYVLDAAGNVSDTVTSPAHAYRVYQTLKRPTVTAAVTGDVNAAMIDTTRSAVYVLQGNQFRVGVFSATTLQPITTVALRGYPISFDITPGGDSLLVTLRGQIEVINLRNLSAAPTILPLTNVDTSAGQVIGQLRIAANNRAFVLRGSPGVLQDSVLEINLSTGTQRVRADAGSANGVSRSLDQRVLTIAGSGCVERYDSATDTFGPCTTTSPSGGAPSVDRTGQHFAIQRTAFDASFAPIVTVTTPWDSSASLLTTISADGACIFYYLPFAGLVRARVSDGAIMDRTVIPAFRSTDFNLSISPDGSSMLLAWDDGADNTGQLSVIDLRDADAQSLQVARVAAPRTPSPLRSSIMPPPAAPDKSRRMPWRAKPPAPRPWRRAATATRPDPGRL